MTRLTTLIVLLFAVSLCVTTGSVSAEETQPAATEQAQPAPQMPAGHPPLPQGHPEVPQSQPKMKNFHGQMPQGHPPVTTPPQEPVVYETTEVEPDWHVGVRHLIVRPMEDQLHITEVWAVVNPTDKSYIGKPVEQQVAGEVAEEVVEVNEAAEAAEGQPAIDQPEAAQDQGRTTLVLPLPKNASHVQPGRGFEAGYVRIEDGKLIRTSPLTPGTNELHINYLLAAENGVFELPLTADATINHMMVFLPDDDSEVKAVGLTEGDPFKAGKKQFRMFMGKQIEKGAEVGLKIKAKPAVTQEAAAAVGVAAPPADSTDQIKVIAMIGGGALLLAALVVMFKPTKKSEPAGATA